MIRSTYAKLSFMPLEPNIKLVPGNCTPLGDALAYCQLVGFLVYVNAMCPNHTYVVHIVIQFMKARCSHRMLVSLRFFNILRSLLSPFLHHSSATTLFRWVIMMCSISVWSTFRLTITCLAASSTNCWFSHNSIVHFDHHANIYTNARLPSHFHFIVSKLKLDHTFRTWVWGSCSLAYIMSILDCLRGLSLQLVLVS